MLEKKHGGEGSCHDGTTTAPSELKKMRLRFHFKKISGTAFALCAEAHCSGKRRILVDFPRIDNAMMMWILFVVCRMHIYYAHTETTK